MPVLSKSSRMRNRLREISPSLLSTVVTAEENKEEIPESSVNEEVLSYTPVRGMLLLDKTLRMPWIITNINPDGTVEIQNRKNFGIKYRANPFDYEPERKINQTITLDSNRTVSA